MKIKNKKQNSLAPFIFLFVFIIGCMILVNLNGKKINKINYDDFAKSLNNNEIKEMKIVTKVRSQNYEITGKLTSYKDNESFILYLPISDEFLSKIIENQQTTNFKLKVEEDPETSSWLQILVEYVPLILFGGAMFWLFTRQLGSNGKSIDFGKSKAVLVDGEKTVEAFTIEKDYKPEDQEDSIFNNTEIVLITIDNKKVK